MPQINLKLDRDPIKIPNRFFSPKKPEKSIQKSREPRISFQETCQENLYEKTNSQE